MLLAYIPLRLGVWLGAERAGDVRAILKVDHTLFVFLICISLWVGSYIIYNSAEKSRFYYKPDCNFSLDISPPVSRLLDIMRLSARKSVNWHLANPQCTWFQKLVHKTF